MTEGYNPERFTGKYDDFYEKCGPELHSKLKNRAAVVFEQVYGVDIDMRVAKGLMEVPRHYFIPPVNPMFWLKAYDDKALPLDIGYGIAKALEDAPEGLSEAEVMDLAQPYFSIISEPILVAYMTQRVLHDDLEGKSALEIGCGTGYQLAMLKVAGFEKVVGVEIKAHLAKGSQNMVGNNEGITVINGDGKSELDGRKFDSIIVSAHTRDWEVIERWKGMLNPHGRMILPVSVPEDMQREMSKVSDEKFEYNPAHSVLALIERNGDGSFVAKQLAHHVRFVELQ